MKITYQIMHSNESSNSFPLAEDEILHEYAMFSSSLSHFGQCFDDHDIKAICLSHQGEGVLLSVEGNVDIETLRNSVRSFLVLLNGMDVGNRVGKPCFVAIEKSA